MSHGSARREQIYPTAAKTEGRPYHLQPSTNHPFIMHPNSFVSQRRRFAHATPLRSAFSTRAVLTFAVLSLVAIGCQSSSDVAEVSEGHGTAANEPASALVAVVHPLQGSGVNGVVRFEAVEGGVAVTAEMTGLPAGKHGFHIHQYGDCTSADGTSAGGHFNPAGVEHSGPDADVRHMGDLGNIESDGNVAILSYVDKAIDLSLILGRGVIVHEKADDLASQPTGAAGGRLGCGVIGVANPG
jgi:Cu-Zn family superoxide dismutase